MTLAERLAAAREGAAAGPVEARGILRVIGKDARAYLHRMSTQHVAALAAGESAYAAFLDGRGHLLGEGLVAARNGDLLVVTEAGEAASLAAHLRKFVIADDVAIEDVSEAHRVVVALGPLGVERARRLAGPGLEAVAATPRRGAPAVEVVAAASAAGALRARLVAEGAADLEEGDLEVLRLEAGIARFGADMGPDRLPMEAGLTRDAIHFDKGCYVGQEVVLRATVRGQLQKGLVQLELPPGAGPGTRLRAGGQDVGWVTSAGETSRGRIGLGYARRAHWIPGARLETDAGTAVVRGVGVHEPEA
jgi:folate-binding protein YgfZ